MNCQCYPEEKDGNYYNMLIAEMFGECLYTEREIASFFVGMSSLLFWLACQIPQFMKNYDQKSATALSKWFLLEWFTGDLLNLVGAFMTHQLATQRATAVLFIINDSLMLMQMTYYRVYGEKIKKDLFKKASRRAAHRSLSEVDNQDQHSDSGSILQQARGLAAYVLPVVAFSAAAIGSNNKLDAPQLTYLDFADSPRTGDLPDCAPKVDIDDFTAALGTTIGWVSACVYLSSRMPQIYKNHKRKSVEGLSVIMFFCAVMGNTTYGLGVLLRDSSWEAIYKALPWLVGSLGTLSLDFFIICQFWYYAEARPDAMDTPLLPPTESLIVGEEIFGDSPARGLFNIRDWSTSPLFKPQHSRRALSPMEPLPPREFEDDDELVRRRESA